jgi:release factor H-coupled RctB family protein
MNSDLIDKSNVKLIASEHTWIEGEAVRQLVKTSELPGIKYSVGLPDLHPGRGNPVGAAFIAQNIIYPYLAGNDVGCGIGLFSTNIKRTKIKTNKWMKKLKDLEQPYDGDLKSWQVEFGFDFALSDVGLGTIGGGNHFAELQIIDKLFDQNALEGLKLDKDFLVLLIHSGSRAIGDSLLRKHTDKYGAKGLSTESLEGQNYSKEHDYALKWAACNRALIAQRFVSKIGALCRSTIDACHNSITRVWYDDSPLWLHRKGAASSEAGPIVIPGSRGSLSYLVKPIGDQRANSWSLPHGAGRKWNRGSCKDRLRKRYTAKTLVQTDIGSHVICEDKDLLYEEAPPAYKNIDTIIDALLKEKLIEIIATLRPIITYKVRKKR